MTSRVLSLLTAAVLLAACGISVADEGGPGPGDTQPGAPTTTPSLPSPGPEEGAHPDDPLVSAVTAFQDWVGHLAAGDHQAAWQAMAPTSQVAVGEGLFFGSIAFELAEGWGSWDAVDGASYRLEKDEAGRTLLWVSGTVMAEGMTEEREMAIPVVEVDSGHRVSPFEEFGRVAEGIEEEIAGAAPPPVPADSGRGRRIVYSNSDQRVWLVGSDEEVVDSYLVSGKMGVPSPGAYEVYSRSEVAYAGHDDITMRYMVRFAHGENLPIGFHSIPNDGAGAPLQSEEQLGEYHSAGCVRQSLAHAAFLYEWATEGTRVIVLA